MCTRATPRPTPATPTSSPRPPARCPHTLRRGGINDDALADLEVIVGFDDDLASEVARVTNRIHGLLTQIHPALERAIGPRLHHKAVLELLTRFGGPARLRAAGRRRLLAAGAVIVALPVVAVYAVLQRQIISGMTDGAVKD